MCVSAWAVFDSWLSTGASPFVEVPRDLEDGAYDVTVTVTGQKSNAAVFTVTDLPLTVKSMHPDSQGPHGPQDVVVIMGTGFGVPNFDFVIADDNRGGGAGLALYDPGQDPWADMFNVTVTLAIWPARLLTVMVEG